MRELTEQQKAFVAHFTSDPHAIGNASESARRAGYSAATAAEQGRQLLVKPHIRAAIDEAHRQLISGTLAAKAVAVLDQILSDPEASPKLKLDAAKTVLDRGGFIAPKASEPERPAGRKLMSEMTVAELEQYVAELQAGARAPRMIDVTPEKPTVDTH